MAAEEAPHVVFFPLMAHGHMIPLYDVARLFTTRGVKATIITTPANAAAFSKSDNISLEIIPFPSEEVGLPAGVENFEHLAGDFNDLLEKFLNAIILLESPFESVLERLRPRPICLVSDMFLAWTVDVAARFGIPRVMFHGSGYFGMMVTDALRIHRPHLAVESEDEEFVVPGVPGEVRLTKKKMSSQWKKEVVDGQKTAPMKLMEAAFAAEKKSYGVIMNSFEELEPLYAEHYRKVMGIRAWSIGPVSLCNRNVEDKAARGKKSAIDKYECLRWLDSKPPDSVIYICFGSLTKMSTAQLHEIAHGLESSGQNFIWVVKRPSDSKMSGSEEDEQWLPSMFEARTKEKGLIIKGWAPQLMILDHVATGGFVTHCGWNSTLEGISAGVRLVTWPIFAEQFLNEKLITEVLRTGVSVGVDRYWDMVVEEASVGREAVETAVRRVMIGDEAEELRRRAEELKEKAWKAVEEGGSSYKGLSDFLEEVGSVHAREEY